MKTQIEKLYEDYQTAMREKAIREALARDAEAKKKSEFLVREFEIAFKEHLPMLKEAGISYTGEELSYDHTVIKFTRGTRTLYMDLNSRFKYRFECTVKTGSSVYAEWVIDTDGAEKFAKFLYEGLFLPVDGSEDEDDYLLVEKQAPKKSKESAISLFFTIFFVVAFVITYRYFDKEAGAFFIGAAIVAYVSTIVNFRLDR